MEKNSVPIQLYLFDLVRKNLSPNESLVDVLADLLKITNDSAYRRLRGSTILDIEELFLICEHFHIPIDSLYNSQDNYVNFKYSPMPSHVSSLSLYIKSILNDIEQIVKAEQKHIVFTSEDLPIFHYFNYPNLTAFKLYYWNRCILNAPGFENKKFDMAQFDEEILQNAAKIYNIYTQIPSTEIWTEDTVESVVKQI